MKTKSSPDNAISLRPETTQEAPKRLAGWDKVDLLPGESKTVELVVDPRLLGTIDSAAKTWQIAAGSYKLMLAHDANDINANSIDISLPARTVNLQGKDKK